MPENNTTESPTEDRLVDYAFWDVPGRAYQVVYSLQLFHEIDFVVNEGYRKIPHGGIEVGGLLFGTIAEAAVRIEAFRPIDCEHAYGPSLNFSERDLGELQKQIQAASTDHELKKLQTVGWFLAHTRGPLELTEAEGKQFDRFFPNPSQLTVLVKPERFQPTRFGFLVRPPNGEMPREATSLAVILPLPGRSHKSGQLVASIPAPAVSTSIKRPSTAAEPPASPSVATGQRPPAKDFEQESQERRVHPPAGQNLPVDPISIWKVPPAGESVENQPERVARTAGPDDVDPHTAEERAARKQLARDRARVMEQAYTAVPPFRPPALPSLPSNAALPHQGGYDGPAYFPGPLGASEAGLTPRVPTVFNPRSMTALALAALLGSVVGYVGYLQLPPPVIPLEVRASSQTIVVSWPPDETRNSIYAAIRFNDGAPVPLSADEKTSGQVSLAAARDFKVEVMSRNWLRDSRGIVRFMRSAYATAPAETQPIR